MTPLKRVEIMFLDESPAEANRLVQALQDQVERIDCSVRSELIDGTRIRRILEQLLSWFLVHLLPLLSPMELSGS